ncbi:TetR/AcrR family transcriptional regulator [Clostridium psychrophilum]|uniref:TetR/AcrR family transcriptional regulator n=1 Tax=Clostridium psychrophilum TaxID=132926 RepID=UPI001C0CF6BB|nr:TetR/AcrR family transcriptional regulator [Clostridium psychrophilum]MBU3182291.1 TetR/AcrR family transcriptional regulator [Clostridium psychrophilum]
MGRPRSSSAKKSIFNCTKKLLCEKNYNSVTIDEISKISGVSKSTIYRWWANKDILIMDIFICEIKSKTQYPDTDNTFSDILSQVMNISEIFNSPLGRSTLEIVVNSNSDEKAKEMYMYHYFVPTRTNALLILERGISRKEINPNIDKESVLDLIYSSLYFRLLINPGTLNKEYFTNKLKIIRMAIEL